MDGKGDIIDQGNAAAELFRQEALTTRKPEGPAATGYCLNCEPMEHFQQTLLEHLLLIARALESRGNE